VSKSEAAAAGTARAKNHDPVKFPGGKVTLDLQCAARHQMSADIDCADREPDRLADNAVKELPSADELAERYRAGASLDDLANQYGGSPYRIRSTLVTAGVAIRPRGSLPPTAAEDPRGRGVLAIRRSVEEVVERYRAGASLDDLAVLCRCSAAKVRTLLVKAGVELRPRGKRITISRPL
jgi:uncharacterized protein (DUF433 family)